MPDPALPSPGAQLRQARELRGESVGEVAFALKLSPRQVVALESDDFVALPGMPFACDQRWIHENPLRPTYCSLLWYAGSRSASVSVTKR